ncbi:unnamed protein product, partial [Gongylonema pulchrum]|uniref:Chromo domain-containing protein n=1 Tax=Gongylonema pulchrum TaxID=637853 RepID=A0A183DB01_9BILA
MSATAAASITKAEGDNVRIESSQKEADDEERCTTPIAECSLPETVPVDDNKETKQTTVPSRPPPVEIQDSAVAGDPEKTPPVPPRSKKRRVGELKCSEVRWFYRKRGTETKWTAFK